MTTYRLALFRGQGGLALAEQEMALLLASRENAREDRVGAHIMIAGKMSKVPVQALEAIRQPKMPARSSAPVSASGRSWQ